MSFSPGEGAIIASPVAQTIVFMGEPWQSFSTSITDGWKIVSSAIPQSGYLTTALEFPVEDLDSWNSIYKMTSSAGVYTQYTVAIRTLGRLLNHKLVSVKHFGFILILFWCFLIGSVVSHMKIKKEI